MFVLAFSGLKHRDISFETFFGPSNFEAQIGALLSFRRFGTFQDGLGLFLNRVLTVPSSTTMKGDEP